MKINPINNLGFRITNSIPKENISGTVPAWLLFAGPMLLGVGGLWLYHLKAERDRDAKYANKSTKKPAAEEDANDTAITSEVNSDVAVPEWEDASAIKDKVVDSELTAHNECINVVVARQNLGKSTIAKQFIVEAIEGVSSNIFPFLNGVTGPQWEAFYYASEADPKFKENFGTKLQELKSRFHILLDNFHFKNIEQAVAHIRQTALNANGNCVMVVDNITDMFPGIKKSQADEFISGLKEIRKCILNQGRKITFIIVVHANRSTGEIAGTAVWENRGEAIFYIEQDKKYNDNDHRVIRIGKNRRGPGYIKIPVKRVMTPYMHFECEDNTPKGADDNESEAQPPEMEIDTRLPVTPEIEDEFASIYQPGVYGYRQIYNDYKDRYLLKDKNVVRNAIVRSQKRNTAA